MTFKGRESTVSVVMGLHVKNPILWARRLGSARYANLFSPQIDFLSSSLLFRF
eukprot:m.219914 g.219914  ORF g.219914 m.219914 type:complete len:53 (+) comp39929_c1_seq12:435-593(+)